MSFHKRMGGKGQAGFTLFELLAAMGLLSLIAYATSMIYFSVLNINAENAWRLPPYDAATTAVQRMSDELRDAMLIESHGDSYIVAVVPERDENGDYLLVEGDGGYSLVAGDRIVFYLSDDTGSLDAQGNCLWKGVVPQGESEISRKVKVAEDIHPELNPVDPDTGEPRPMFDYRPDDVRLWGVEVWVTSTAEVKGETRTQTAHSEAYLRNL